MVNAAGFPEEEIDDQPQNNVIMANESEDDDVVDLEYGGYEPLRMNDYEYEQNINDESDEEQNTVQEQETNQQDSNFPNIEPVETTLVREVWSGPNQSSDIPLDSNKIDEIKEVMKNITLPSMPDWATNDEIVKTLIDKSRKLN